MVGTQPCDAPRRNRSHSRNSAGSKDYSTGSQHRKGPAIAVNNSRVCIFIIDEGFCKNARDKASTGHVLPKEKYIVVVFGAVSLRTFAYRATWYAWWPCVVWRVGVASRAKGGRSKRLFAVAWIWRWHRRDPPLATSRSLKLGARGFCSLVMSVLCLPACVYRRPCSLPGHGLVGFHFFVWFDGPSLCAPTPRRMPPSPAARALLRAQRRAELKKRWCCCGYLTPWEVLCALVVFSCFFLVTPSLLALAGSKFAAATAGPFAAICLLVIGVVVEITLTYAPIPRRLWRPRYGLRRGLRGEGRSRSRGLVFIFFFLRLSVTLILCR